MIQVAFVGCAHSHAPNFAKKLNERPDVSVKSVWDHDSDRADKYAADLGAKKTDDLSTIWSDSDIRAVVICSETIYHESLVPARGRGEERPLCGETYRFVWARKTPGRWRRLSNRPESCSKRVTSCGGFRSTGFSRKRSQKGVSGRSRAFVMPPVMVVRSSVGSIRISDGWPTRNKPAAVRLATWGHIPSTSFSG